MAPAIIFDLFDTLIPQYNPNRGPRDHAERLGLDPALFDGAWAVRHERRMAGRLYDFRAALRDVCESFGDTPDEVVIQALYREVVEEIAEAGPSHALGHMVS